MKNIDKRFKSSLPVLSAFSAFDPMLIPDRQSPAFHSHGDAEVKVLLTISFRMTARQRNLKRNGKS